MLKQALFAPVRSSDALPTLLIGSALVLLSAVVVSAAGFLVTRTPAGLALVPLALLLPLVLLGYELRVLRAGVRGERGTPSFVDWSGLVRGGVGSLAVTLGYLIPAVVLAAGAYALSVGFGDAAGTVPRSALGRDATAYGGAGLLGLYGLLLLPLRPAALSVYAATGRFRSAFALRRVLGVVTSGRFLVGWALGSLVVLLGVVVFPLAFYARVVAHSLYGHAAGPSLDAGSAGDDPADEGPDVREAGPGDHGGRSRPLDAVDGATGRDDLAGVGAPDAEREADASLDAYDPDELSVAPDDAESERLVDPGAAFASFEVDEDEADDDRADREGGDRGTIEDGSDEEDEGGDGFEWGRVE